MEIIKTIYNQTTKHYRVNNKILAPGEELQIIDWIFDIYKSLDEAYKFDDDDIVKYITSDEFIIYLTDQHGYIESANFSDSTLFLSMDTGKCCLYLARDDTPIINPPIYTRYGTVNRWKQFYNKLK